VPRYSDFVTYHYYITKYIYIYIYIYILQYAGSSWDELKHIRQAIGFLVSFHSLLFSNFLLLLVSEVATNCGVLKYSIFYSGHTSKTKENTG
jgi:hypothetical protein